jgi:hypothetical protein
MIDSNLTQWRREGFWFPKCGFYQLELCVVNRLRCRIVGQGLGGWEFSACDELLQGVPRIYLHISLHFRGVGLQ